MSKSTIGKIRTRIWSEEEYYADLTAPRSGLLPLLPADAASAIDQAITGLVAIFANAPPRKPGRSPLSPGIITYDLVRLRNGDIAFLPSIGAILVNRAWRDIFGR